AHLAEEHSELRVVERDGREVLAHARPRPPAALAEPREAIDVELAAHEARRAFGEGVSREEAEHVAIGLEELLRERDEPGRVLVRAERREPNLPVEAEVIRRDDAGPPHRVARR